MRAGQRDALERQATKLSLITIFFGTMAAFSTRVVHRDRELALSPFDLLLLGLTSFRTGRILAYERVAEPIREPFTETRPDDTGVGETVVAEGTGARFAIGELLSCPICVATWVAAGLVYGLHLLPRPTRVFLAIMSATGVAEIVYELTEFLSWGARAARRESGD